MAMNISDLADVTVLIQQWVEKEFGPTTEGATTISCFKFTHEHVELKRVHLFKGGGHGEESVRRTWPQVEKYLREKGFI